MRDEHRRNAQLALHLADRAAQLFPDLGIERSEGLIEQEHFRLVGECARHGDPLLLAARELRRETIVHALQGDETQELLAALAALGRFHPPHAECEFDVFSDSHVEEQRVVLEHQTDATLAGGSVRDVAAVERDAPMVDA